MRKNWREIVLFIPEKENLVYIVPEERTEIKKGKIFGKASLIFPLIYLTNVYYVATITHSSRCQGYNGKQVGFSF